MQHSGLTGFEIGKSLLYARARADFCILTALFSPSFSGTGTREKAFFRNGKSALFVRDIKNRRHGLRGERKSGCTAEKTAGMGKDGNGETRREKAIQHNVMLPFTSERQNITGKPLCLPHNILNGEISRQYCRRKEAEQR